MILIQEKDIQQALPGGARQKPEKARHARGGYVDTHVAVEILETDHDDHFGNSKGVVDT